MAQKAPIDNNYKNPPPVHFENILEELPKNMKGIRPLIESPEITIKKAIRNSLIISLVMLIITSSAVYFAYLNITKMAANLQNKQNLIYLASRKSQTNIELLKLWTRIGPKYEKINNTLPASKDLLDYTGVLAQIATKTSVSQKIQLQTPKTQDSIPANNSTNQISSTTKNGSSVDYTIELKGGFDQFISYIDKLENAPFFTQITSLNFSSSQNLDKDANASISAKLYTYP